ncbi:DUF327 family protein [Bacillus carboniphilus]|uniref:DUF327 family protein n=1 Tax=Bacillus carboniphilus TaxID=86663 RepID=A0ABY9JW65_9BACI|nr:DUF327 family protein [Bacillus carboniphilus]WLR41911.1 DUF327 family protein [Bacillus carboniphilus]
MKINQEIRSTIEHINKETKNNGKPSVTFHQVVEEQGYKQKVNQLNMLLKDIDLASERLVRSQTVQELSQYKNLIKNFIQEVVSHGLSLKKVDHFDQFYQKKNVCNYRKNR